MTQELSVKYLDKKISITNDACKFRDALIAAMETRPYDRLQLDIFEKEFYQGIIDTGGYLFLSEDSCFGCYVSKEGEIGSLFKNRNSKTIDVASTMLTIAVRFGGKYFNAYGTNQLESLYVSNKFNPVARMRFSEELAPEGWQNSSLKNKPDVVFYAYSPNGFYTIGCGAYFEDWNEANNYSISLSKNLTNGR